MSRAQVDSAAARHLLQTWKRLQEEPVHGAYVEMGDNVLDWTVYLEGPKDCPYEGGIFAARLSFPADFPMSPPKMKFLSEIWHPNVYADGTVCISILHPPGDDQLSGETAFERWLPIQTVETVLLSVLVMIASPNPDSPANVDAAVQWRRDREAYNRRAKELAARANADVPPHVQIPHPDTNVKERKAAAFDDMYDNYDGFDDDDDGDYGFDGSGDDDDL